MLCSFLTAIDSKRLIRFPPNLKFKQNGEQDVPVPLVCFHIFVLETELLILLISASYSRLASLNKSQRFVRVI